MIATMRYWVQGEEKPRFVEVRILERFPDGDMLVQRADNFQFSLARPAFWGTD